MARYGHDFKVVMAFFPPVIYAGMPEVMENESLYSGLFANRLMGYPNVMGCEGLPVSMKDKITVRYPRQSRGLDKTVNRSKRLKTVSYLKVATLH